MKKFKPLISFISLFIILLLSYSSVDAQQISYSGNWGPNGFTLTSQKSTGVGVNFSVTKLYLEDVDVNGSTLKAAKIEGVFLPNDAGKPDLAGTGRYIAIPQGAVATYRIVSVRTEVIKNVDIAPAPVIPKDDDPTPLKYNKDFSVYGKSGLYPESPVILSERQQIRGVDVVMLGITPFQYNPLTKELTVYKDIQVEVNFVGGNGHFGNDSYRNRWWEPILSDAIANYSSLPKIDFSMQYKNMMDAYGYEYVIIIPNNPVYAPWADTLRKFRTAQGIKTGVFTLAQIGGNNVEGIKAWVTNAYNNWPIKPVAVCLMADYSTDPSGNTGIISKLQPDSGYPDFASDNYYADVNNDEMPEIVFSRIIGNNDTELQTLITKNINYEKNPPTNPNFYSKPITALGWQTERWFQICSEVLGGFFRKMGKTPVRINKVYSGTPGTSWSSATNTATVVNYFGTAGSLKYIPMTPDSLGGWDGGTATMVNNAINQGSFILQHRDHGMYTGWGEPSYTTSNISALNNTDLTFVYSINCQTGAYHNPSGCPANGSFVEVFYRYKYNNQNSGALGLVCPAEVSYSFVNDTYCWGMYDNMWPNFMPGYGSTPPSRDVKPAFGMTAGKYFLQQSSWPYNTSSKLVTYRLFHMHGDAFLNLFYEVPQNLVVNHASVVLSGVNTFSVTANSGSFIAVTQDTSVLGTAAGTGSPVSITIPGTQVPGQFLKVVVTKQNYYRYESNVQVIPPSGPYVIKDSVAINDASPLGNGNGLMDYGETNKLALRVKNVGSATATGVTVKVTENDPYVTMTDSTETYGDISANTTMIKTDAFIYTVANNIPEGRSVDFVVTVTGSSTSWTSNFIMTAHSPILKMGTYSIVDSAGNNNGRFDPGETVKLNIPIKNTGSSNAAGVCARLFALTSGITIAGDSLHYGMINFNDSLKKQYNVSAEPSIPLGTIAKFVLKSYAAGGEITRIDSFEVTVGMNWSIIGTGTTSSNFPFTTYWKDGRTQYLYLASEINSASVLITQIGFDVLNVGGPAMTGFTVSFQNTTA
ncbi:MAG: C25 family cysteine peptidase, partial [Candidatus Kapaibacterium sp.]